MASLAPPITRIRVADDRRFFFGLAAAMGIANVLGFGMQFAMGRSSVHVPALVHLHALVFTGWVALFVWQSWLAASGRHADHRRLGRIGAGWAAVMIVVGSLATLRVLRAGTVPFFFTPAEFLVMSILSVLVFAGLLWWGIALRRRSDWHRRIVICAMTAIMGPALGRLLPAPLMIPWTSEAMFVAMMLFPLAGMIRDRMRTGRVHPAWWYGAGVLVAMQAAVTLIGGSAVGAALVGLATASSPGAAIAPLAYPPFPPMG